MLVFGRRLFECDSPNQLLEPRVYANPVKPRLKVQPDHAIAAVRDGLVEPVKGLVRFAQHGVNAGDLIGAYVAAARVDLDLSE